MAIGQFTKRVTTFISGLDLKMFRYDCLDNGIGESQKLKQIVKHYYRNNPPLGFNKEKK